MRSAHPEQAGAVHIRKWGLQHNQYRQNTQVLQRFSGHGRFSVWFPLQRDPWAISIPSVKGSICWSFSVLGHRSFLSKKAHSRTCWSLSLGEKEKVQIFPIPQQALLLCLRLPSILGTRMNWKLGLWTLIKRMSHGGREKEERERASHGLQGLGQAWVWSGSCVVSATDVQDVRKFLRGLGALLSVVSGCREQEIKIFFHSFWIYQLCSTWAGAHIVKVILLKVAQITV